VILGGLTVDGDFGWKTLNATINFQKAHGLDPDGEVGPRTWAALLDTL
jgi:peptidoglycan hydrolase-like protein with peptidoglycan-binding domain